MDTTRIETAEHVLPGHPDKLCDAAADAIVERLRTRDPGCQCGLEAACVFDTFHLTGRIAATEAALDDLDLEAIIRNSYAEAGYGTGGAGRTWGPEPERLAITTRLCLGPYGEGERELRHLSDDQAICVGYANDDPLTGHMPPAVWLARRIARHLFDRIRRDGAGEAGPDGKVLVRVARHGGHWRPLGVSISLSHHEESDWLHLRRLAEAAVADACTGLPDPEVRLNGAGMFVSPGPNGDNGLTGKKLVVDAYGPTVPIGGGAWSGKDLRKVDRLGGLLARWLARCAVARGVGREVVVHLEYRPGSDRPAGVAAVADGRPVEPADLLHRLGDPDLTNEAVWHRFRDPAAPLPHLARWGHQQPGLPWEETG